MKPEDVRKLLGGYAPGTLTEEERKALFEAALSDQSLFNELAGEQAFRELLEDERARQQLLNALGEKQPLATRFKAWFGRPVAWAAAGSLAAAVLLVAVFVRTGSPPLKEEPVLIAKHEQAPVQEFERPTAPPQAAPTRRVLPKPRAPAPPPAPVEEVAATKGEVAAVTLPTLSKSIETPVAEQEVRGASADSARVKAVRAATPDKQTARLIFSISTSPIRHRILRADANGSFSEVAPETVFASRDLVRVTFEPIESGRLQVTSAGVEGGSTIVFENSVEKGVTYNVDVPPGAQKLLAVFSPHTSRASETIEIPIRRQGNR
jgi:hypothetical protein